MTDDFVRRVNVEEFIRRAIRWHGRMLRITKGQAEAIRRGNRGI